jgi:hypothetical protein
VTFTADTDQHPEVTEISALAEGILSPRRTADVQEHLKGCGLCADVLTSLDEIRAVLGTLPGPVRMPADVAGRIDAALAAGALLDATSPAAVSRETEVSRETAPRTPHAGQSSPSAQAPRIAQIPRNAQAPQAGLPPQAPSPADRSGGHRQAADGPGRSRRPRRHWRTAVLGTACVLAAVGLGTLLVQSLDSTADGSPAGARTVEKSISDSASGFTAADLESRVQELLAQASADDSPEFGVQSGPDGPVPLHGGTLSIPSCVRDGIGRTDIPLAAQSGTYEGDDAYLVVLPHVSDTRRVNAYVVDAVCAERTPSAPGKVLLQGIYPRG